MQCLSCFVLFLRKCDNSWTWLYVKCKIKRNIHYPTEKNIVTVIKTVLKQIVFVFPCNHILWEMKSIKFELAKILNSDNENKWIKSVWQNYVPAWIVEKLNGRFLIWFYIIDSFIVKINISINFWIIPRYINPSISYNNQH